MGRGLASGSEQYSYISRSFQDGTAKDNSNFGRPDDGEMDVAIGKP
jgi:hypothetical protein